MAESEDKLFLKRLEEYISRVQNRSEVIVSDFWDTHQQSLAEEMLQTSGINYLLFGGFAEAERRRAVLSPDYLEIEEAYAEITALDLRGNFSYTTVSHRDYLGALLSLGVKREKFGDILVRADGAYVFLTEEIASYVLNNLPKVKGVSLSAQSIALDELIIPEGDKKEKDITCASLRLDAVTAQGFNLSRSQCAELLKSRKIQLNHREVLDGDYRVSEGDILSVRGKGRLKIEEIIGNTKKGKIRIKLIKYGG